MLSNFEEIGYAVFRAAIDVTEVDRTEREIVRSYEGSLDRQDGAKLAWRNLGTSRSGLLNSHLCQTPEIHPFVSAFREILVSSAIFDALHGIDGEEHYTLHQSIFFFESPLTPPHIESMTLDTTPRGLSRTVWGAIDPITPMNGPAYVVPRRAREYESDPEEKTKAAHRQMTLENLCVRESHIHALVMAPGSIAVWAPSTPHGSMPPHPRYAGRRSFQAIYRPTRITKWGGYPHHDQEHLPSDEEFGVNRNFSFLRI